MTLEVVVNIGISTMVTSWVGRRSKRMVSRILPIREKSPGGHVRAKQGVLGWARYLWAKG